MTVNFVLLAVFFLDRKVNEWAIAVIGIFTVFGINVVLARAAYHGVMLKGEDLTV